MEEVVPATLVEVFLVDIAEVATPAMAAIPMAAPAVPRGNPLALVQCVMAQVKAATRLFMNPTILGRITPAIAAPVVTRNQLTVTDVPIVSPAMVLVLCPIKCSLGLSEVS